MKRLRRSLPLIISAVLLVIMILYTPWHQVAAILADFDLSTILLLIALSLLYYGVKALRFWYMLRAMAINQPLSVVAVSYMSAQPVTLLPAGEIYRSQALQRHTGVPLHLSLPQFTMQGLFEGIAMAALGILSAVAVGHLQAPLITLAVIMMLLLLLIRRGYITNLMALLNRLPFINVKGQRITEFSQGHQAMLSGRWLPLLLSLSLLIEIAGTGIAYASTTGLGVNINIFQAVLFYIVPVIVGFISFLPGGLGASEQSAIGVLLLTHTDVAHAVTSTLIMRVTIVGLGQLYGVVALAVAHYWLPRPKQ